ncbi:MAG: hypothetical protein M3O22_08500 [Pseudomonadota bacterium]|nr:hypothetical protein [Pseudomonadota bacterium]
MTDSYQKKHRSAAFIGFGLVFSRVLSGIGVSPAHWFLVVTHLNARRGNMKPFLKILEQFSVKASHGNRDQFLKLWDQVLLEFNKAAEDPETGAIKLYNKKIWLVDGQNQRTDFWPKGFEGTEADLIRHGNETGLAMADGFLLPCDRIFTVIVDAIRLMLMASERIRGVQGWASLSGDHEKMLSDLWQAHENAKASLQGKNSVAESGPEKSPENTVKDPARDFSAVMAEAMENAGHPLVTPALVSLMSVRSDVLDLARTVLRKAAPGTIDADTMLRRLTDLVRLETERERFSIPAEDRNGPWRETGTPENFFVESGGQWGVHPRVLHMITSVMQGQLVPSEDSLETIIDSCRLLVMVFRHAQRCKDWDTADMEDVWPGARVIFDRLRTARAAVGNAMESDQSRILRRQERQKARDEERRKAEAELDQLSAAKALEAARVQGQSLSGGSSSPPKKPETVPGPVTGVGLSSSVFRKIDRGVAMARFTALSAALYGVLGLEQVDWTDSAALKEALKAVHPDLAEGKPAGEKQKDAVLLRALDVMPYTVNGLSDGGPQLAQWCLDRLAEGRAAFPDLRPDAKDLDAARVRIAAASGGEARLGVILAVLAEQTMVVLDRTPVVVQAAAPIP